MTYSMLSYALLFFSSFLGGANEANNSLNTKIIWVDNFTSSEKEKITVWLDGVSNAVSNTLGQYPFKVKYYLHHTTSSREPVPWANTVRNGEQGVHFHVDPDFSLNRFQKDWTAAHEISHLSIPFVGRSNMWFSEGYASFMQWHVLQKQGLFTAKEVEAKCLAKLKKIKPSYNSDDPFLEVSNRLKRSSNYSALYWGGACYFMQIDAALRTEHNTSLMAVIKLYQKDGRLKDGSLEEVIASLDRVSNTHLFSQTLLDFKTKSAREVIENTKYMPY